MEFNSEKHTWKTRRAANDREKLLPLLAVNPTSFLLSTCYLWSACSISILHSCLSSLPFHQGSHQNPRLLLTSIPLYSAPGCSLNFTPDPFFQGLGCAAVENDSFKSPLVSPNHTEIARNSVQSLKSRLREVQGSLQGLAFSQKSCPHCFCLLTAEPPSWYILTFFQSIDYK